MKGILLLSCLCIASLAAVGQDMKKQPDTLATRHTMTLSLGTPLDIMHSQIPSGDPLFTIAYERRIHRFGFGGAIALSDFSTSPTRSVTDNVSVTFFIAYVKANYYFLQTRKIDLYGGIMAGGMFGPQESLGWQGNASDSYGFKVGCQAGVHFWAGKKFGFLGELALGTARFNLGIMFRRYA